MSLLDLFEPPVPPKPDKVSFVRNLMEHRLTEYQRAEKRYETARLRRERERKRQEAKLTVEQAKQLRLAQKAAQAKRYRERIRQSELGKEEFQRDLREKIAKLRRVAGSQNEQRSE